MQDKITNFVELSQFILSSLADNARLRAYEGLIKLGLTVNPESNGKSLDDIRKTIIQHCNFIELPPILIEPIIQNLVDKEIIKTKEIDNKIFYSLSEDENKKISILIENNQQSLHNIYNNLFSQIEKRIGVLTKFQKNEIESAFDRYIGATIGSSIDLASSIYKKSGEHKLPYFPHIDSITEIITNSTIRDIFKNVLKDMHLKPTKEFKKFLFNSAATSLFIKIINMDPNLKNFEHHLLNNITIYIDTNIIIALFQENHLRHKQVKELITLTKQLGINVKYSYVTKKEFFSAIEHANKIFKQTGGKRNTNCAIIDDYLLRKKVGSVESWEMYLAKLKNVDEILKKKYDIICELPDYNFLENLIKEKPEIEIFYDKLKMKVGSYGFWKRESVIEHDAFHMLYIQLDRNENSFKSPWFLTLDHSLLKVDEDLSIDYSIFSKYPSSIHCDAWLQFILPFISPKHITDNLEDIFCDFLASHFFTIGQTFDSNLLFLVLKPIIDDLETLNEDDLPNIIQSSYVQKIISEYDSEIDINLESDKFRKAIISSIGNIHEKKIKNLEKDRNKAETDLSYLKEKRVKEKKQIEDLEIIKNQKISEISLINKEKRKLEKERLKLIAEQEKIKKERDTIEKEHKLLIKKLLPFSIIHVSDLHFGNEDTMIIEQFIHDIGVNFQNMVNYIVITGDITNGGFQSEFNKANGFLNDISIKLDIPLNSILILPGNHDILKEKLFYIFRRKDYKLSKGKMRIFEKVFPYSNIKKSGLISIKDYNLGKIFITIIGIDSSFINSISTGKVGYKILNEIEEEIIKRDKRISKDVIGIRILALHHHLKRIPNAEGLESLLLLKDAATVLQKIKELNFDIILNGHKHIKYLTEEYNSFFKKNMYIINAPSLCKKNENQNGYYFLNFTENDLTLNFRKFNNTYFETSEIIKFNIFSNGLQKIG